MEVLFELFGYFKAKTGKDRMTVNLPDAGQVTVYDVLKKLDTLFCEKGFSILQDGKVKKGVIFFLKEETGKMIRLSEEYDLADRERPLLVLSNLMGGG